MKIKKLSGKTASVGNQGFSLIELLIVIAILGILSIAIGVNINSAKTKLKTFVFNTKTRFNQARFEAIKSSRNVYLDFDFYTAPSFSVYAPDGKVDNGYAIWMDDDGDATYDDDWSAADPYVDANANNQCDPGEGDCNSNGECDPGEGDCLIDTVVFGSDGSSPEIYCSTCASGGPGNDGPGVDKTIVDGISASGNRFQFKPNGDSGDGTAYFYFPQGNEVLSGPFAIIVNTVGRIRIDEWKSAGYGWEVNT